ncbi:MAG: hypothetical protein ACQGVK_08015 [Myxococcota bacterium]
MRPLTAVPGRAAGGLATCLILLVGGTALGSDSTSGGAPPVVEILHMEANEGGGAGGHAGIRLGDQVYHFEFGESGRLVMARDAWLDVERQYSEIENRPIHVAALDVSHETARLLQRSLNRRYLAQRRHLERLAQLRAERSLLEAWATAPGAGAPEAPAVPVAAAGYFFHRLPPRGPRAGGSAALASLGESIRASHGPRAISDRAAALRAELSALAPDPAPVEAPADARLPAPRGSLALRYAEILEELAALEVLERAPALRDDALVELGGASAALSTRERARLEALADRLAGEAQALFDSPRPDRGRALLVVSARLAAIEASLLGDRWRPLATVQEDGDLVPAEVFERRPDLAPRAHAAALEDWRSVRRAFAAPELAGELAGEPAGERGWVRLERAANRLASWRRADLEGVSVRFGGPSGTPARPAPWAGAPRPARGDWDVLAGRARLREEAFAGELDGLYGYDLVRRNCASEIFQAIHDAFAELEPPDGVEAESTRRLGGYVGPNRGLAFIPFVSQWEARRSYRVRETRTIPAWRARRVHELASSGSRFWVGLRESIRWTADSYAPHPQDSYFVFFTEKAAPVRPLLGAVNVAAGVVQGAVGLVTWPFDRGRRLLGGWKGAVVSLPELVFVNIRKGTNEVLPPEDPPLEGASREPAARADQGRDRMSLQPPNGFRSAVADSR